jgi:phosphocarrier protein
VLNQKVEIINKLGLHARAASVFVKTAAAFSSQITVSSPAKDANGKSIMSIMMLEASIGTKIDITIDGEDEAEAMKAITALINNKFGEPE